MHPAMIWERLVSLAQISLHFDRGLDGLDHAIERCQDAVPSGIYDVAFVCRDVFRRRLRDSWSNARIVARSSSAISREVASDIRR